MAFVMIAGPQILSAIFLATSENWRRNSAAYVAGAALSITVIVTIAYVVGRGALNAGAAHDTLDIVVLVLLAAAALHPWWHYLPFVRLTLLILALPSILLLVFGHRAQTFLPKGARLDESELVGNQRDRDRVLHRHHGKQPRGLASSLCRFTRASMSAASEEPGVFLRLCHTPALRDERAPALAPSPRRSGREPTGRLLRADSLFAFD